MIPPHWRKIPNTDDEGGDQGRHSDGSQYSQKRGLVRDVKVEGSLGCNDNEMLEFRILKVGNKRNSKKLGTLEEKTMKASA